MPTTAFERSLLGTHEVCQRCGAQVEPGKTASHSRWHAEVDGIAARLQRVEDMLLSTQADHH